MLIHAYDPVKGYDGTLVSLQGRDPAADVVMFFVSQIFARLSVPAFFVFAGFFFFRSTFASGLNRWVTEVAKRIRTLLIPFLIWSLLVLLVYYAAQRIGVVPVGEDSRVGNIAQLSLVEIIDLLLGVTRYPVAYQFWFLRDLIVCVAISLPVIFASRGAFITVTAVLGLCWFSGYGVTLIPSSTALFFFLLGGLSSVVRCNLELPVPAPFLIVGLVILAICDFLAKDSEAGEYIHRAFLLCGVASLSLVGKLISRNETIAGSIKALGATAFFLYAAHEPGLMALKKFLVNLYPWEGTIQVLFAFFLPALLVIVLCGAAYKFLASVVPKFLSVSTGGRN
ncbi:hypothetical protein ASD88_23540 [Pelomonas sp. Root662]|nr:hypothetical protein ASC81_21955 [Pelomonas sp. Root405]KRA67582.1 hypothetical protein ASD88_23540 [Pelomonas sp. Root662]